MMAIWRLKRKCCLSCLQFLLLAVFQTDAYVSVNMGMHCNSDLSPTIMNLKPTGSHSAAIIELNVKKSPEDLRCQLEITAPPHHLLTVHLVNSKHKELFRHDYRKRRGFQPCFLKLSPIMKEEQMPSQWLARTWSLCGGSDVPVNTLALTSHVILSWSPPDATLREKMVASHLVVTAVGTGADVCSSRGRTLCLMGSHHLCIPSDLACDGFHNCPIAGEDENPRECAAAAALMSGLNSNPHEAIGDYFTKAILRALSKPRINQTVTKETAEVENKTPLLSDVSSILLKGLLNHKGPRTGLNSTSMTLVTTTTSKPAWHPQTPKTLAHYGPWGYLMLGMLICGAVLMLCGLWECCCRSSKHRLPPGGPMSTSAATTVFIINSTPHRNRNAQQQQCLPEEPPPTPGPPSYEELDQPPPYSSLFPMTKIASSEAINIEDSRVISGDHI